MGGVAGSTIGLHLSKALFTLFALLTESSFTLFVSNIGGADRVFHRGFFAFVFGVSNRGDTTLALNNGIG
ncbi:MAG: hypothetical protein BWY69_01500 [Planctomycetes bacterium ADurb.Bin401]|nr:MAG: hypothetical protein BWY69_01500 [Planctomycetes bacterium ADurb.Bin401]